MNIAMEQTEEYVNGQLKNKYGDAFIRGNNGTLMDLTLYFTAVIQPSCWPVSLLFDWFFSLLMQFSTLVHQRGH
jgi:hypothetical protein